MRSQKSDHSNHNVEIIYNRKYLSNILISISYHHKKKKKRERILIFKFFVGINFSYFHK